MQGTVFHEVEVDVDIEATPRTCQTHATAIKPIIGQQ
jgi:hypothetical protein